MIGGDGEDAFIEPSEPGDPVEPDAFRRSLKFNLLRTIIDGTAWQAEPPNHLPSYNDGWLNPARVSGTIMPPSPGVATIGVKGVYNPALLKAHYDVTATLRPEAWSRLRVLDKFQLAHRSRLAAVGIRPLCFNEMARRNARIVDTRDQVLKYAVSDRQSYEMATSLLDITGKHLRLDPVYIERYLTEHKTSSLGAGTRWGDLIGGSVSDWKGVLDSVKGALERLRAAVEDKRYLSKPFNTGLRARSSDFLWDGKGTIETKGTEMTRTRVVMFNAGLSSWNAFLPDKKQYVADYLAELGAGSNIVTPLRDGGSVYTSVHNWLGEGYKQSPYDGKSWESVVPLLLGPYFNAFWTVTDGVKHLPSGMALTSLVNTAASYYAQDRIFGSTDRYVCILGDDVNVYSKRTLRNVKVEPVLEYQPEDAKAGFMLGVGFNPDPDAPRVYGLKLTTDRGDKARHLRIDESGRFGATIVGSASEQLVDTWCGLYEGRFADTTLIDVLRRASAEEWKGPSELIEDITRRELK